MLPDNALLDIFDFYKNHPTSRIVDGISSSGLSWRWKTLTQVCRRWKYIIFGSPRRLGLQVVCTDTTPTRTSLDIWPPFPISICCRHRVDEKGVENVIAAVERHNRVFRIIIQDIECSAFVKLAVAMQETLPILDVLYLRSTDESLPVLPETFLGEYVPLTRLRFVSLFGIHLPTFPKFITSTTRIGYLHLEIPNYISPDVMVTGLAALSKLESLCIQFRSPLTRPLQLSPPPLTRVVLPTLKRCLFRGVSKYFEEFVSRVDTPLLKDLLVMFFMDFIFDVPRLHHFIDRTERLKPFYQANMKINNREIFIIFGLPRRFGLGIQCKRPDQQLSWMTRIFGQQLPLLSQVEQLEIAQSRSENIERRDGPDMDSSLWLELFHLFIAVQRLYISERLAPSVAAALQGLTGERTMEVLPALNSLSLEGFEPSGAVEEGIKSFVASRRLSGRPIAIQGWELE
jgi:hypothetical protein